MAAPSAAPEAVDAVACCASLSGDGEFLKAEPTAR